MAKKKKKKKQHSRKAATPAKPPEELEQQFEKALQELRGRRASVLGEKIREQSALDEETRKSALARGNEALLRELIEKGHVPQAEAKAKKLLQAHPWQEAYWSLGLQLRLKLLEDVSERLRDADGLHRLRCELVDPADLLGIPDEALSGQARSVLQAWERVEAGAFAEGMELLRSIGRRSPLVDWRLFVQALASALQQDPDGMQAALRRMQEGVPAQAAGVALEGCVSPDRQRPGPFSRRLQALEEFMKNGRMSLSGMAPLKKFIKFAVQQKRPSLALDAAVSSGVNPEGEIMGSRMVEMIQSNASEGFSLLHFSIRILHDDDPGFGMLDEELFDFFQDATYLSRKESALFHAERARQRKQMIQEQAESRHHYGYGDPLERLPTLFQDCAESVRLDPRNREIYEIWSWGEEQEGKGTTRAAELFAENFPDHPDVLAHCAERQAQAGKFSEADRILEKLEKLPGSAARAEHVRQSNLYLRIRQAFLSGDSPAVEKFGSAFHSDNMFEQVAATVYRWLSARGGRKRSLGLELEAIGSPWLVFQTARTVQHSFNAGKLPVAVQRALKENPASVLRGFSDLFETNPSEAKRTVDAILIRPVAGALEHPDTALPLVRKTLETLLYNYSVPRRLGSQFNGFFVPVNRLLDSVPDDQAHGLAMRVLMVDLELGEEEEFFEQLLDAARVLAETEPTRTLVSRVAARLHVHLPSGEGGLSAAEAAAEVGRQRNLTSFDLLNRYLDECLDEEVELRAPPAAYVPPSFRPFAFSKIEPSSEIEFEVMLCQILATTSGENQKETLATYADMVRGSVLSDTAKERLLARLPNSSTPS